MVGFLALEANLASVGLLIAQSRCARSAVQILRQAGPSTGRDRRFTACRRNSAQRALLPFAFP